MTPTCPFSTYFPLFFSAYALLSQGYVCASDWPCVAVWIDGSRKAEVTSLMLCLLFPTAANICVSVCRICAGGRVVTWSNMTHIVAIVSPYKQSL